MRPSTRNMKNTKYMSVYDGAPVLLNESHVAELNWRLTTLSASCRVWPPLTNGRAGTPYDDVRTRGGNDVY